MIVLDVDNVVADFSQGIEKRYPQLKSHDKKLYDFPDYVRWDEVYRDMMFWMYLPVLDKPTVPVHAYLSHRPFPEYVTQFWLYDNDFPDAKVIHVNSSPEKLEILKEINVKLYVDDKVSTFHECREAGINAYLYTQPWNEDIDTPYRISKLSEIEEIWKNLQ
jgi:hypothetical protein